MRGISARVRILCDSVHGTQQEIGQIFEHAEEKSPAIIFFDEIDAFIPKREGIDHHYSAEVNEFLAQMSDCAKRGILVIGATNCLERLDPAVLRAGRFDKKIYVGPPDLEARIEAVTMYMKDRPQERIGYCDLLESKPLYSYADLELVVNEAARDAAEEGGPIAQRHLEEAFSRVKASISDKTIENLLTMLEDMLEE